MSPLAALTQEFRSLRPRTPPMTTVTRTPTKALYLSRRMKPDMSTKIHQPESEHIPDRVTIIKTRKDSQDREFSSLGRTDGNGKPDQDMDIGDDQ